LGSFCKGNKSLGTFERGESLVELVFAKKDLSGSNLCKRMHWKQLNRESYVCKLEFSGLKFVQNKTLETFEPRKLFLQKKDLSGSNLCKRKHWKHLNQESYVCKKWTFLV